MLRNNLKVELWKRLRARAGNYAQSSQQESKQQTTGQFEYRWEGDEEKQDPYARAKKKNSGTPLWIAIGLIILVIAFVTQGKWKRSPSYMPPEVVHHVPSETEPPKESEEAPLVDPDLEDRARESAEVLYSNLEDQQ